MLHSVFLIIAGLVLVGFLSADFEMLGMRNHPYLERILAAVCVIIAAYTHTWTLLAIVIALTTVFLMVRRDFQRRAEQKAQRVKQI